jgi:hypothetical protein
MVMSPAGLGPEDDLAGEDPWPLDTRGSTHQQTRHLSDSNKNLVVGSRYQGRLAY